MQWRPQVGVVNPVTGFKPPMGLFCKNITGTTT